VRMPISWRSLNIGLGILAGLCLLASVSAQAAPFSRPNPRCCVSEICYDNVPGQLRCVCSSTPTCQNGVIDVNETGVDCGGPCTACLVPVACISGFANRGCQVSMMTAMTCDGEFVRTDCLPGERGCQRPSQTNGPLCGSGDPQWTRGGYCVADPTC